ncbi:MAG TPA: hypothetical protein VFW75_17670 [Acetobacteraceae bacterium]|nr:hypothetical protein [Acetobacteraceae bacterium]
MYETLRRRLSPRLADMVTVVWYTTLIALAAWSSFTPQADFKYLSF